MATSRDTGTGFYDVTNSTNGAGSILINFFPKQDTSDAREGGLNQAWNQTKANSKTKFVYQAMGEMNSLALRSNITIFDCNNIHNNEVKKVASFNERWDLSIPAHKKILQSVYDEAASTFKKEYGTTSFSCFGDWIDKLDINKRYVIGDCHNLQVDSHNNLLLIVDVGNKDLLPNRAEITFPTLVYDINPLKKNAITGLPCSESPEMITDLEDCAELKQLTDEEISLIHTATENGTLDQVPQDDEGNMVLNPPMNDPSRKSVKLSVFGSLPSSAVKGEAGTFNRSAQCQYNHDVSTFQKDGKSYVIACYQEIGWYGRSNKNSWLFGFTMGQYAIYDVTNIRTGVEQVYQTSIVLKGFNGKNVPLDCFSHNGKASSDGNML